MAMTIAEQQSGGRALVPGLGTVQPLASTLPSLLQEDDFCVRLTSAFDSVLAPVLATLDCFEAYLDPRIAPQDFADWLAGWVGLEIDETWPPDRRRTLAAEAIELFRRRGTVAGLARHVELYSGVVPSIEESGGCAWSQDAGEQLPGSPQRQVVVRVELDEPNHVDAAVLDRIVRLSRPAHVLHGVYVDIKSDVGQGKAGTQELAFSHVTSVAGEAQAQSEDIGASESPSPVHPPESSVVEVGPGVPAEPDEPDAPGNISVEPLDEDDTGTGLSDRGIDEFDAGPGPNGEGARGERERVDGHASQHDGPGMAAGSDQDGEGGAGPNGSDGDQPGEST